MAMSSIPSSFAHTTTLRVLLSTYDTIPTNIPKRSTFVTQNSWICAHHSLSETSSNECVSCKMRTRMRWVIESVKVQQLRRRRRWLSPQNRRLVLDRNHNY